MGVQERRERERLETREKILDAARELFVNEGYEGVSMRKVAEMIEYSPTAIYGHFADKEDLFLQLCHADFRMLAQSFTQLAQISDPVQRLRRIGQAYSEFGLQNPNHYLMMFMTAHPQLSGVEEHEQKMGKGNPEEDAYEFLRLAVEAAMRVHAFRDDLDDPDLIAQTLWAGIHGVVALQIAKSGDHWVPWRSIESRAELMLDALLRGLLRKEP